MKRTQVLNHKLRLMHKCDGQRDLDEKSLWYVCKVCNLEIYWSDFERDKDMPWKIWERNPILSNIINLNITCEEQQVKSLLE